MSNKLSISDIKPAFLTDNRGLGGGETSLLNLLEALVSRGVRPLLLCPEGDLLREASKLAIDRYPVEFPDVHLRGGIVPTLSLPWVLRIARCFRKKGVNLVHAESLLGLYYGGLAAVLCSIPMVATYHGYWPLGSFYNKLFLRLFCRRVYPVSRAMEAEIKPLFGPKSGCVRRMPLGVSTAFLRELPGREEARRRLGLPIDRSIVLQVARFEAIKGHHHLLRALPLLVRDLRKDAPLVVFAGGVLEPPSQEVLDYKARIEELAKEPAIRPYVRFLGHRKDVPLLMRAADVVVSPSEFESFGMALIEAMIIGTPVVATDAGGPREIIVQGVTGILVAPGEPADLAAAICRAIEDSAGSSRMAAAARDIAQNCYSPEKRCETLLQEYFKLVR